MKTQNVNEIYVSANFEKSKLSEMKNETYSEIQKYRKMLTRKSQSRNRSVWQDANKTSILDQMNFDKEAAGPQKLRKNHLKANIE